MRRTSTFGFVWLTPPLPGSCKYHEVPSVEPATNSFVARLTRDHFVNIPYDLTLNSLLLNLCIASLPFLRKLANLHEKPTYSLPRFESEVRRLTRPTEWVTGQPLGNQEAQPPTLKSAAHMIRYRDRMYICDQLKNASQKSSPANTALQRHSEEH